MHKLFHDWDARAARHHKLYPKGVLLAMFHAPVIRGRKQAEVLYPEHYGVKQQNVDRPEPTGVDSDPDF